MEVLNYISVTESARREITATGARLAVRISGQSFFTGREALKKAAEVAECVTGLSACGIEEEKIRIKNVATQVGSGFLTKSSSATYDLEVACDSMELLGAAVAKIATLKNSEIESMAWDYTDIEKVKRELLDAAVRSADAAAKAIVSALNTSLVGIHRLNYKVSGLDNESETLHDMHRSRVKFAAASHGHDSDSSRLNLSHTANVVVDVSADFLVRSDC